MKSFASFLEFEKELKAGKSDHKFVNFSEDYELEYHLKKVNKSQSKANITILRDEMGPEAKKANGLTNSQNITHEKFHNYIKQEKNLKRLENKQ